MLKLHILRHYFKSTHCFYDLLFSEKMSVVTCAVTEIVVAIGDSYWRCVSCQLKFSLQTSIDKHVLLKHRGNDAESSYAGTLPPSYQSHSYNVNIDGNCGDRDVEKHQTSDTTCLVPGVVKVNLDNSGVRQSSQSNTPCCLTETSHFPLANYSSETQAISLPFSFLSHENADSPDTGKSPETTSHTYPGSTGTETERMTMNGVNENVQGTSEIQIPRESLEKSNEDNLDGKDEDDVLANGNKSLLNSMLGLLEKSMDMDDITGVIQNWDALNPELFEQQLLNNTGDLSLQSLNSDCVAPDPAENPLNSTEEMLNTAVESFNCSAEFFNSATELLHSSPTEVSKNRKSSSTSDSCAAEEMDLQEKSCGFTDITVGKPTASTSQGYISEGKTISKVDECKISGSESDDSTDDEEEDEIINNVVDLLKGYLKFSSTHCQLLNAVSLTMSTSNDTKTCDSPPAISRTSTNGQECSVSLDSNALGSSLLSTLPADLERGGELGDRKSDKNNSPVTETSCVSDDLNVSNIDKGEVRVNTSAAQSLAKLCLLQRHSKEMSKGVPNLFIASSPSPLICLTSKILKPLMNTEVTPSHPQRCDMTSLWSKEKSSHNDGKERKGKLMSKYCKQDLRSKANPEDSSVSEKAMAKSENTNSVKKCSKRQLTLNLEDIICEVNEQQASAKKHCKSAVAETSFSKKIEQRLKSERKAESVQIRMLVSKAKDSHSALVPSCYMLKQDKDSEVSDTHLGQTSTEKKVSPGVIGINKKVCNTRKQRALKARKGIGDGKVETVTHKKINRGLSALQVVQVRKLKNEVLSIIKQQRKSRQDSPSRKVFSHTSGSDVKNSEKAEGKGEKYVLSDQTDKINSSGVKNNKSGQGSDSKKKKAADKWKMCSVCDRRFSTYGALQRHIKVNTVSSDACKCKVCGQKFHCLFQLNIHIYKCHETRGKPTCFKCNTQYSNIRCLVQHVQKHKRALQLGTVKPQLPVSTKGKAWRCPTCGTICLNQPHIVAAHKCKGTVSQDRKCKQCDKTFPSRSSLNIHMAAHQGRMYECDLCGEMFKNKTSRHYHKLSHESVRGQFLCQICGQQFEFQQKLTTHIKIHSKDNKPRPTYKCGDCDKTYKSKKSLQRHVDVQHKGIKDYEYKCEHCNQQFFASWQLRDHIAWHHFGEKPYHCQYCGQGFVCRPTLVRHQRKEHTGDRPYKCQYCEQSFVDKKNLETHEVKVHTQIFPFPCSRCGKGFVHRSSLRSHMAMHSNIRPYQCHICGNCFTKSSHLTRHTQSCMNKNIPQTLTYDLEDLPGIPSRPSVSLAQFMLPQPEDVSLLNFSGSFLEPSY